VVTPLTLVVTPLTLVVTPLTLVVTPLTLGGHAIIDFGPIGLAYSHVQGAFLFDWVILPKNLYNNNSAPLPSLAIVAKEVLSIPSGSASVQKIFSPAGLLSRHHEPEAQDWPNS
jgi:hypothetical protein